MELSPDDLQEALETCAAEPVHILGVIQPIGYLLGLSLIHI